MKNIGFVVVSLIGISLLHGCSSLSWKNKSLNGDVASLLWVQTASEYRANALQTYNVAADALVEAMNDPARTAMLEQHSDYMDLPPAVVMDIDETVLDNSPFQVRLLEKGKKWNSEAWDAWVALRAATAVPGAVDFINQAGDKGIAVIFISNRACTPRQADNDPCPQETDTMENLRKAGVERVSRDRILLKNERSGWTSEKESRRQYIARSYRVIMLFGDDLGDFLPNVKSHVTPEERAGLVQKYKDYWGRKWFVLANPEYGSWLNILEDPKSQYLIMY